MCEEGLKHDELASSEKKKHSRVYGRRDALSGYWWPAFGRIVGKPIRDS